MLGWLSSCSLQPLSMASWSTGNNSSQNRLSVYSMKRSTLIMISLQMTNEIGKTLFSRAGELGVPVGFMCMKVLFCSWILQLFRPHSLFSGIILQRFISASSIKIFMLSHCPFIYAQLRKSSNIFGYAHYHDWLMDTIMLGFSGSWSASVRNLNFVCRISFNCCAAWSSGFL